MKNLAISFGKSIVWAEQKTLDGGGTTVTARKEDGVCKLRMHKDGEIIEVPFDPYMLIDWVTFIHKQENDNTTRSS